MNTTTRRGNREASKSTSEDVEDTELGDAGSGIKFFEVCGCQNIKQHNDLTKSESRSLRNAVTAERQLWHDGVVPYALSDEYTGDEKQLIKGAMQTFHENTCVRFVPTLPHHQHYIDIKPVQFCDSIIGRSPKEGAQTVSLIHECLSNGPGRLQHELMHAIGFYHEHVRRDRDDWVRIYWENIMDDRFGDFDIPHWGTVTDLDEPYDYDSIMHYGPRAWSKNHLETIEPQRRGGKAIGQRKALSAGDIAKIRKLYKCPNTTTTTTTTAAYETTSISSNSASLTFFSSNTTPIVGKPATTSLSSQPATYLPTSASSSETPNVHTITYPSEAVNTTPNQITSTVRSVTSSKGVTEPPCKDWGKYCMCWAVKPHEYCSQYEVVRTWVCRKSCGTCEMSF